MNKVTLVIMDGVGITKEEYGNAVMKANTPNLDKLMSKYPNTLINAHGTYVGLSSNSDMGNSEVGHNAMGCGQVYSQGAKLVNEAIESVIPDVDYELDESGWYAKDTVTLEGEDLEVFNKLYNMLDEIEDVTDIYHNVNL